MSTTFLVTGATGRQGGAVARHLLAAKQRVRILVRSPKHAAAEALAKMGAEIATGEFGDAGSLRRAVAGVDGVFSVQPLMLGKKSRIEVEWGKALADAAHAAVAGHFVYTSVLGAAAAVEVAHFASKGEIENHIRRLGMRHTILQPAGFMENLLLPQIRSGIRKGKLTLPNAMDAMQPAIAVDDIGAIAAKVLMNPENFAGKTLPLAGEVLNTRKQAAVLSRVLGREITPGRLPWVIVRVFIGKDLQRMFRWNDEHSGALEFSIDTLKSIHPGLTSFEAWCRKRAEEGAFS